MELEVGVDRVEIIGGASVAVDAEPKLFDDIILDPLVWVNEFGTGEVLTSEANETGYIELKAGVDGVEIIGGASVAVDEKSKLLDDFVSDPLVWENEFGTGVVLKSEAN
ncbi:unnamed protein product [Meganyctiphanes norvegica]|uniref:Uncharacterized protein n=1 Tax=Meganyctiphanes norvegica TaxID=48144 RepID=A0AAV2RMF7_MEGNR